MRRTAMSMFVGALALAAMAVANPAAATPWLGVYSQDITPELREGMNYNGSGALVSRVVSGSPADRAGIERGDVIVQVGGQDVDSPTDLVEAVGSASENASVDVLVVRDGAKKSLRVKLAERPENGDGSDDTPMPSMPGMRGMKGMRGMPRVHVMTPESPGSPKSPRVFMEHHSDGDDDDENAPDVLSRLPELLGGSMLGRARLGVRIESLNPDLATYFGSRDAKGALVLEVVDGSAAEKAGIRAGDVIQKLDNESIESSEDLTRAVGASDKSVSITLLRHGAKQTVRAELGDAPQAMRFRGGPQGFNWKSNGNNKTFDWQSPDGSRRVKRIVIDGDDDDHGTMPRRKLSADRESTDQLREEMQQLREQLDQLREELKSNR